MTLSPKILITGASGFTGQHACHYFCLKGYQVIAVSNKQSIEYEDGRIEIIQCDLTNKVQVQHLIESVAPDYLLHLAGMNNVKDSWENPLLALELNMMATANLIETIRHHAENCKIIIVGSTLQFNLTDLTTLNHPYSLSKTLQILISRSWHSLYKQPLLIANPTNLIGPGKSNGICSIIASKIVNLEKVGELGIIHLDNPLIERDFLDVRDAVAAYEVLLHYGESGQIYNLTSGQSRSLGEIVDIFSTLTTIKVDTQSLEKEGETTFISIPPTKLMKLGWKPTTTIEMSLKDTLDYYRNQDASSYLQKSRTT